MSALTLWAIVLPSLLAGALLAAVLARRHARIRDELRRAREDLRRLSEQLDVWQWRSDAEHRLRWLRAPAGGDTPPLAAGTPLAERITFAAPQALRQQLDAGAALHDVEGRFAAAPDEPSRRALLRRPPPMRRPTPPSANPSATPSRTTCARRSAWSRASPRSSRRTTAPAWIASATTTSTACSAPPRA